MNGLPESCPNEGHYLDLLYLSFPGVWVLCDSRILVMTYLSSHCARISIQVLEGQTHLTDLIRVCRHS